MIRPLSSLFMLLLGLAFAVPAQAVTACAAGNPNTASVAESTPTSALTVNSSAGTVTHALTGLTWKQCSQGQSGAACQSTGNAGNNYGATTMTWSAALAAAAADVTDGGGWRLPNKKELESIVETCGYNPSINQTAFPATVASFYWSASSYVPNPTSAWGVPFNVGYYNAYGKSYNYYVRLVRGGQSLDAFDAQADTIPAVFSFTAQTGATLGATATSDTITVSGINSASPISISGGSYKIGSGSYVTSSATVNNGDMVTVQQTASGSAGTLTTATLTIGSSSADFNVTTISNQATLSVTAPTSLTYGGTTATLNASGGGGGGALSYSAGGSTGCAVLVDVLSVTNASGTCTVTATKAADAGYLAATSSGASVTLNKASQGAVTLTSTSGSLGTPLTLSASGGSSTGGYSYAVNSTGTAGCSISGGSSLNATSAGSCTVIATRSADANYNAASSAATTVTINAAPSKTVTAASPAGSGSITAAFTGGNGSCSYVSSQFSIAQTPPAGVTLNYGVFNFTTNDCGAGSALSFTITYPQTLPSGTRYYKYGPEFGASQTPHWYVLPGAVVSGNQISFTITDNGAGDSNPAAGFITDPGGPGVPDAVVATAIPTLSEWGMLMLGSLMALFGMARLRHLQTAPQTRRSRR